MEHLRDHQYWAFHRQMREDGTSERPDHHTAGIFADYLDDQTNEWRAPLFRNTGDFRDPSTVHGGLKPWTVTRHGEGRGPTVELSPWTMASPDIIHHEWKKHLGYTHLRGGYDEHGNPAYVAYSHIPHPASTTPEEILRFYSVLHPEHLDQMVARADERTAAAITHARRAADANRPPAPKVKLARSAVGRLWDRITGGGKPTEWHPHYDGIVHVGGGLEGYPKAHAERTAVAHALQKIGGGWLTEEKVRRYTHLASRFVRLFPDHPVAKHYTEKAGAINVPAAVGQDGRYQTVDATGPVGGELGHAATPLVRFLNRIEARQGRDEVIAPQLPDHLKPTPAPAAPEEDVEWHPAIKKAAADAERIPLASLRGRKKGRVAAEPDRPAGDLPPIPLANYPGEVGPTGDRWGDLDRLHKDGHTRVQLVKHLMDRYALSKRNAAETLKRWADRKRVKLARPRDPKVTPIADRPAAEHLGGAGVEHPILHGTRLAFHLRGLVNEGVRTRDHVLTTLARKALGFRDVADDKANPESDYWAFRHADPVNAAVASTTGGTKAEVPAKRRDWFATLGGYLKSKNHYLRDAYHWGTMGQKLHQDWAVKQALKKIMTGWDGDTHKLYTGVHRKFDTVFGTHKDDPRAGQFWKRLAKETGVRTQAALLDSIRRLADHEEHRREVGSDADVGEGAKKDGDPRTNWRDYFSWLPGAKWMKFDRKDKLDLIKLARTNPTIRESLRKLKLGLLHPSHYAEMTHAADPTRMILADRMDDAGDPRADLIRHGVHSDAEDGGIARWYPKMNADREATEKRSRLEDGYDGWVTWDSTPGVNVKVDGRGAPGHHVTVFNYRGSHQPRTAPPGMHLVRWFDGEQYGRPPFFDKHMTANEYKEWVRRFPEELHGELLRAGGHHHAG
jgi:hypothetical protein